MPPGTTNQQLKDMVLALQQKFVDQEATVGALQTQIGHLGAENEQLMEQIRSNKIQLEAAKASQLLPAHLSEALDTKMTFAKDMIKQTRIAHTLLSGPDPDMKGGKDAIAIAYRLSNHFIAGAELSKQVTYKQMNFVDTYYAECRANGLLAPAEGWSPEDELVILEDKRKAAVRIHEAKEGTGTGDRQNKKGRGQHNGDQYRPYNRIRDQNGGGNGGQGGNGGGGGRGYNGGNQIGQQFQQPPPPPGQPGRRG